MNKELLDKAMSMRNPDVTGRYIHHEANDQYVFLSSSAPRRHFVPTAEKAATDLRFLMIGMQKFKSSVTSAIGDDTTGALANLHPWVFGPKGIALLTNLSKALDGYEETKRIDGSFYYNSVVIVNLLAPRLREMMEAVGYKDFPEEVHPLVGAMVLE